MADRMLQFVSLAQHQPDKRASSMRREDFAEIYADFDPAQAGAQSSRCSQCGVPFCQVHCPLANNIPDWLKLTAENRLQEAYEVSSATNTFPEICGRICPQDRLCEGNCVIEKDFGSVTIGSVEKFITDTAWENGWVKPIRIVADRGAQSVAIIGAGPAGLTAAEMLRIKGYDVHIYDRHDRAGGLLTYGIPGFKLEKDVVMRRVARLEAAGIVFRRSFEVGRDASLAELRARHDAVLIATGVYQARDIAAPGVAADGVIPALDFLFAANRQGFGDTVPNAAALDAQGKHVVVIGGGDTAMDCVRTAVRQGAASVKCLYRRDRTNMPGSQREVGHAEEEGVEFVWLSAPQAFDTTGSSVSGVRAQRMRLGAAAPDGRRAPEVHPGSNFRVEASLVIKALGFDAEDLPVQFDAPALSVTRWGTLRVDHKTMATSVEGVFAAGDIVRGASLVVWAIRDGRDVAAAMHKYLAAKVDAERVAA